MRLWIIFICASFFILCALPGYLNAQFTVLMERYPPNCYFDDAPSRISSEELNFLIKKIQDPEGLRLLKNCYLFDNSSKSSILKNNLSTAQEEELKNLLIVTGYLQPKGLEVEITREVLLQMGIKPEYKLYPWARCIEMMKNGNANAIITVFKTPEREQFLYYPSTYTVLEENALFKLNDTKIYFDGNLEKLYAQGIAVKSKTSYGKSFDNAKLQKYEVPYTQDVIRLVQNNRVKLGIGPVRVISYWTKKMGIFNKFTFLKPFVCNDPLYMAFSKKKDTAKLADEFSRYLKIFKKTAKYREILSRYGL